MNRIEKTLINCRNNNKPGIIPFITAGVPDIKTTVDIIITLEKAGAAIIEIGIPFSDPLADGPVIQRSSQQALRKGINLQKIIRMTGKLKQKITSPLVLMGYYNSILNYGKQNFVEDIAEAGIEGIIIPDLPYEEDSKFYEQLYRYNIAGILLVAPNTPEARLQKIAGNSSGFLYCVSLLGVTGDQRGSFAGIEKYTDRIRKYTDLPLALGFGIDGPRKAKRIAPHVEGIIIGSALIKIILNNRDNKNRMLTEIYSFINEIT